VAAVGLVSAAAALFYRKPKLAVTGNDGTHTAPAELMDAASSAASQTVRKVKRKAVAAAGAVAATVEASAAKLGAHGEASLDVDQAAVASPLAQRTRKRRSDAGIKRGTRKTLPVADAAVGTEPVFSASLVSGDKMETSALAFGFNPSKPTADVAPARSAAEEQLAEAHPS
jgi:hypothetical protein